MRVLHVLSQRPSLTGSGITLDALVRHAASNGWDQRVVVGVPPDDSSPAVGGLDPSDIRPLVFGRPPIDFALPGMSDVMPYPSSRFQDLQPGQIEGYHQAWRKHLGDEIEAFRPDIIHSHHIWLVSALLKDLVGSTPVVTHCHATGLRQMEICPHLAPDVLLGCSRNEAFAVLHEGHAKELSRIPGIGNRRIAKVGAGYREDLFNARGRAPVLEPALVYVGKYSDSKGLPWLLDAFDGLRSRRPGLRLHIAGGGSGARADELRARMDLMAPAVVQHGRVSQAQVANLVRRSTVCVLPSFYEGLPLVLVEAFASGCRLVATALPGITEELSPRLGDALTTVTCPRLVAVDQPDPRDLGAFVRDLETALEQTLDREPLEDPMQCMAGALEPFTWTAVFARVEDLWKELI